MSFEQYILPENDGPKLAINLFMSLLGEYVRGEITAAEAKTYIEEALTSDNGGDAVTLDASDITDLNAIVSSIDAAVGAAAKELVILEMRDVFDIAENSDVTLYSTRAALKVRLNFS